MCFNAISDYHVTGVAPRRGASWHETFSGTPVKFSSIRIPAPQRAPRLGEHTAEVLAEVLHLTQADLERLGIGVPPAAA